MSGRKTTGNQVERPLVPTEPRVRKIATGWNISGAQSAGYVSHHKGWDLGVENGLSGEFNRLLAVGISPRKSPSVSPKRDKRHSHDRGRTTQRVVELIERLGSAEVGVVVGVESH